MLLNNRLGIFLFFMLRNDQVWSLLTEKEKQSVLETNDYHNNYRPDYADPDLYQSGRNFDSQEDRLQDMRGQLLKKHLDKTNPKSVLEVGPGSGFLTRMICEHPSVTQYYAVDINDAFLSWLDLRLEEVKKDKPGFDHKTFHGNFAKLELPPSDAVILLSSAHHIPNRVDLFKELSGILVPGGYVFAIDGSHYWPRQYDLLLKYLRKYSKRDYWGNPLNLGTHHYCTWEEYRRVMNQIPELDVFSCDYYELAFPTWSRKIVSRLFQIFKGKELSPQLLIENRNSLLRFFSSQIAIALQKPKDGLQSRKF